MIEKVLYLLNLLDQLNRHPMLKGKWVLKGGTALNLFVFDLHRLSEACKKIRSSHRVQVMKRMLADAGKPDVPGLYISRNCSYFWMTVPGLGRDQKRVEDLNTRQADYAADACRYALTFQKSKITPFAPMDGIT